MGLFKAEFGSAGPSCHYPVSSARLFFMHGVSHSCSWPLARCDGGWDSSRDGSGDSSGTACRLLFSRDRV